VAVSVDDVYVLIATVTWYDASWWTAFGGIASLLAVVAAGVTVYYARSTLREANAAGREAREDRRHVRLERVAELLARMNLIASGGGDAYRDSYSPGYMADRQQLLHTLDVLAFIGGPDLPECRVIAEWDNAVINEKATGLFAKAFAEVRAQLT
jgi:hypothetical protein